ncbi:MAG: YicC family protein, partial [Planctomycetota bacterium]
LEAWLARRVARGSVSLTVRLGDGTARSAGRINTEALRGYLQQLQAVDAGARIDAGALLGLPGVVIDDGGAAICVAAKPVLERLLEEATKALFAMRDREGEALRVQLLSFGEQIEQRLKEVAERAPEVSRLYGERLKTRLNAMLAEAGMAARQEDVLREIATFAERADVAEEVQRLGGHLQQFRKLLDPKNPEAVGRTLDFLAQEMLREANTIASKASDLEIARRVVEMKTAIDRIKEQAANAE